MPIVCLLLKSVFETGKFVITTQWVFRARFILGRNDDVMLRILKPIAVSIFYPEKHHSEQEGDIIATCLSSIVSPGDNLKCESYFCHTLYIYIYILV